MPYHNHKQVKDYYYKNNTNLLPASIFKLLGTYTEKSQLPIVASKARATLVFLDVTVPTYPVRNTVQRESRAAGKLRMLPVARVTLSFFPPRASFVYFWIHHQKTFLCSKSSDIQSKLERKHWRLWFRPFFGDFSAVFGTADPSLLETLSSLGFHDTKSLCFSFLSPLPLLLLFSLL